MPVVSDVRDLQQQALLSRALGAMVDRAADDGDRWRAQHEIRGREIPATPYDAVRRLPLTTDQYLQRWMAYAPNAPYLFLAAGVYVDVFVDTQRMHVTHFNKFRLLLSALVVADKRHNDSALTNAEYAAIGGVTTKELSRLERMFLRDIDFNLHIDTEDVARYRARIEDEVEAIAGGGHRKRRRRVSSLSLGCLSPASSVARPMDPVEYDGLSPASMQSGRTPRNRPRLPALRDARSQPPSSTYMTVPSDCGTMPVATAVTSCREAAVARSCGGSGPRAGGSRLSMTMPLGPV